MIRPKHGRRLTRVVGTEQDAIDLVHHFNRLGMAGVDLAAALAEARTAEARECPPLREVLPAFLDEQVALDNIRRATAAAYRGTLRRWIGLGPRGDGEAARLGDVPWNEITREELGAVLLAVRRAKKSFSVVDQVRAPLAKFYAWQMNVHGWLGPSPAADLKYFLGKRGRQRRDEYKWFDRSDALTLLEAARALRPRWHAFILLSFVTGGRWGEMAALTRTDIDWRSGQIHIQRTWSEKGQRLEPCKDADHRWVKVQLPEALEALRAHLEALGLEAQLRGWTAEARRLVFPSTRGRILGYGIFRKRVWVPVLGDQLGHASIEETEGTYGHLERRRHEAHDLSGHLHSGYLHGSSRQSASTPRSLEDETRRNSMRRLRHNLV